MDHGKVARTTAYHTEFADKQAFDKYVKSRPSEWFRWICKPENVNYLIDAVVTQEVETARQENALGAEMTPRDRANQQ